MTTYIRRFDTYNSRPVTSAHSIDNTPILRDFDAIIRGSFGSFVDSSRRLGSELTTTIEHLTRLFNAQKDFIRFAIQNRKPDNDQQLTDMIKSQSNEIEAICGKLSVFYITTFLTSFY